MAISTPQRYLSDGLVWRITGSPYTRRTRITLLLQGRYAACLRENRELYRGAIATAAGALRVNAPVDTGMLRASVRNEGEAVTLGPEPYDRTLLKARLAGSGPLRVRGGVGRGVGQSSQSITPCRLTQGRAARSTSRIRWTLPPSPSSKCAGAMKA